MKDEIEKKIKVHLEEDDLSKKPKDPFDIKELVEKWNLYADKLKKKGKEGMYVTLTKIPPVLMEDNFSVLFEIDSEVQRMELQNESVHLLNFLRKQLNNYTIKLQLKVMDHDDEAKEHLSSKDKFLKMTEKNSNLKLLKDKFNLDIEY